MDVQSVIGYNVARLRKKADLSQEELALRVEVVAQTYVSNLEAGKCNPTAVTLHLIAKALNVSVGDLFLTTEVPPEFVVGPVRIRSSRSGKRTI
jgi:transcriptional regulator with XRE-family HTH domain